VSDKEDRTPLKEGDLSGEDQRIYEYIFFGQGHSVTLKIDKPYRVYYGMGHAFHRVVDENGKVHLCHAPGPIRDLDHNNIVGICKIHWEPKDKSRPVKW
jgi:hypothetical protein